MIKEYFANYRFHMSDITVNFREHEIKVNETYVEPWSVTLVDTGEGTMTGGRLRRVARYLENDELFCFTYGDGVANVDIARVIEFHREHGKLATVTAIQQPGRFGQLAIDRGRVVGFTEKPQGDGAWINGGYFVLSKGAIDYIDDDETPWEREPMERLASNGELAAFKHFGFWHPMDTMRDQRLLEELWAGPSCPWKVW